MVGAPVFLAMNKRTTVYCLIVIAVAILILPFQDWQVFGNMEPRHIRGFAVIVLLAVLSEVLPVISTVGRHQINSSIAFIPFFTCVLLFPSPAALSAAIVTSGIAQFLVHKRSAVRAAFNTAQGAISVWVASAFYEVLGGKHAIPVAIDLKSVSDIIAFAGMAFAFFLMNQVLVSVAIALSKEERMATVLNRVLAPGGANFIYDLVVSPVAVIVALLYSSIEAPGLIIGILPLLIMRHSYAANAKLEHANKDLLTVLVKTIETRDPYTSGHSIRVSILARAIAEDMDLSPARIDQIEMTALVHDVGKIDAVYAPIISKEGALTDSEWFVIRTHAAKGAEFLETLSSFPKEVISSVRHHHERYDGTGYPDGIGGMEIPLPARIIMLSDSIDAMLSDRPYRKALSVAHVRGELARCAGTQFDPKIVEQILRKNTLERAAMLVRPEEKKPQLVKVIA
jgi:putative nucleotidyltransferase with HDIG domain